MKKKVSTIAMAAMALAFASCGTTQKAQQNSTAKTDMEITRNEDLMDPGYLILSDAQRQLIAQNNQFALRLFGQLSGFDSKVVSPMSVTYLMAMLANGADGQTQQEILKAIGAEGNSLDDMNALYHYLMNYCKKADPSTTLSLANYIALNQKYQLKAPFAKTLSDSYEAGIESLDFTNSKTTTRINDWCKKQTDGMIPRIIDQVDPSAVSYIMNAIFFNGSWTDKFDKNETKLESFQGYTRDIKRVQMMHRNDKYFYYADDTYSAIDMPYGNRTYRMTVLLPNADKSISDMMKQVSVEGLQEMNRKMENCVVDLKMPRFTTEMELPLNGIISKLGAPSMFTGSADFSRFADGNMMVSKMLQKAKIEVSEEGTKAAAVTAAIMTMSALRPEEPRHVEFHANRPFVYMITESSTGAILFMGQFTGE